MRVVLILAAAVVLSLGIVGCGGGNEETEGNQEVVVPVPNMPGAPAVGELQTTDSGLGYYVLAEGGGQQAQLGNGVSVHYTGYLKSNGEKFDSSLDLGRPFQFTLGTDPVIDGWLEGLQLMSVGDTYKLVIPAALGYGAGGFSSLIPPNSELVFDVELLEVR